MVSVVVVRVGSPVFRLRGVIDAIGVGCDVGVSWLLSDVSFCALYFRCH